MGLSVRARFRLGVGLAVAGILLVLTGVFHVLGAAQGDEPAHTFRQRRSYDQVKVAVHRALPTAAAYAAGGLLLAIWGGRLAGAARLGGTARGADDDGAPGERSEADAP